MGILFFNWYFLDLRSDPFLSCIHITADADPHLCCRETEVRNYAQYLNKKLVPPAVQGFEGVGGSHVVGQDTTISAPKCIIYKASKEKILF